MLGFRRVRKSRFRIIVVGVTAGSLLVMQPAQGLESARAAAAGHSPSIPAQQSGSAAGRSHTATSAQTRAKAAAAGTRPGRVKGALLPYAPSSPKLKPTKSGALRGGSIGPATKLPPGTASDGSAPDPAAARAGSAGVSPSAAPPSSSAKPSARPGSHFDATLSSANQQVFANPDGTYTAHVYSSPVDYQSSSGAWTPIDTTLTAGSDGRYHETASAQPVTVAASGAAPDLMSLRLDAAHSVSFGLDGAAAVAPSVSGGDATYPGIEPGVDLRLSATTSGLEQSLVLHSAADAGPWYFSLDAVGLTARAGAAGSIVLADSAGTARIEIPAGSMQDSALSAATHSGATSTGVSYRLVTRGGRQELELDVDKAWLADPARVFPVTVDPTAIPLSVNASSTTYVHQGDPGPHGTSQLLDVGVDNLGHQAVSYVSFSGIGSGTLQNAYVTDAFLYLFNVESGSCTPSQVNVSQVLASWDVNTVASPPGPAFAGTPLATGDYAAGTTPTPGVNCGAAAGAWEGFPLSSTGVSLVDNWTHNQGPNYGFAVWTSSTASAAWKQFASANTPNKPYLAVDYSPYADTASLATGTWTTPPTASTAGSVQIKLTNQGSATWSSSYQLVSTQENAAGAVLSTTRVPLSSVAPGASTTVTLSVPPQPAGVQYQLLLDVSGPGSPPLFSAWDSPPTRIPYQDANIIPQMDLEIPQNNATVGTLTPELSASGHDPDHYPNASVQYVIEVCAGTPDAPGACASSGLLPVGTQTWAVPLGMLSWNQTYFWWALDYDGSAYSAAPLASFFTTVPSQADLRSHLGSNNAAHGVDPEAGNYTTTVTDASVETAGPPLAITRTYNSLDPSLADAFGEGWSTVLDAKAAWTTDGTSDIVITMPDGTQARYARNPDGTYSPPAGDSALAIELPNFSGVKLVDSRGTVYLFSSGFTNETYGPAFLLTSITDAAGLGESFTYNTSGEATKITNLVSGRSLTLTWSTPTGAQFQHVAQVTTPLANTSDPNSAEVWTYTYTNDDLHTVCAPAQQPTCTAVTTYGYTAGSQYSTTVMDADPASYWRLGDWSQSTLAYSQILANEGNDNGTYTPGVSQGVTGPLGSGATASHFDGSTGDVALNGIVPSGGPSAVELFFRTSGTNEVLFSYQRDALTPGGTTTVPYTPAIYIGSDGKVNAEFWYAGGAVPITTSSAYNDGGWHDLVLTTDATGASQTLYLDGALQGSVSGGVSTGALGGQNNVYIGGGYLGGSWPDEANHLRSGSTGYASYFNGDIAEVSFFDHPLDGQTVTDQYYSKQHGAHFLNSVDLPSGAAHAAISYDPASERVTSVTDENGQTWKLDNPGVTGSTSLYRGAVVGSAPSGYWQLADSAGLNADNEIKSGYGTYSNVTLNETGPFADGAGASAGFDGASSYLQLPNGLIPAEHPNGSGNTPDPMSVELWFRTSGSNEVLFASQVYGLTASPPAGYFTPILYVGTDGRLVGSLPVNGNNELESKAAVNDGKWHYAVLSTNGTSSQGLYVDGVQQATGAFDPGYLYQWSQNLDFVGAGDLGKGPLGQLYPDQNDPGNATSYPTYFNGDIAQVAFYHNTLSSAQVAAHFRAYGNSAGLAPVLAVNLTDPDNAVQTYRYDPLNNGREISVTDAVGATTSYGYDTSGFLNTVLDPNRNETITQHDTHGNVVSRSSCQSTAQQLCSTQYYTYNYPDASGVNEAAGGTVTASSTTTPGAWATGHLVDGIAASTTTSLGYSSGPNNASDWVEVAMTAQHVIDRVDLFPRTDDPNEGVCFPVSFTIQVSTNGSTWTTVANETNYTLPPGTDADQTFSFPATQAGWIKVTATKMSKDSYGNSYMQLAELEASDDSPDPAANQMLSSSDGRSASSTDATYRTTYRYDTHAQLTDTIAPPVAGYPNGLDNQTSYTTATTPAYGGGYAPAGLVAGTLDPDGATTSKKYYSDGDLESTTDTAGLVTSYTYDNLGHVLTQTVADQVTPPGGTTYTTDSITTYTYDAQGRVLTETDPTVSDVLTQGVGHTPKTTYTYDSDGNKTQQQTVDTGDGDVTRTTKWTYDTSDRLIQQTDAAGGVTKYQYSATIVPPTGSSYSYADPFGAPVQMTDADGNVTQYTYDADGRLATTSLLNYTGAPYSASSPGTLVQDSRAYDPAGRLASDTDAMGNTTSYAYYDNDLLQSKTITGQSAATVMDSRTYDAAGNLATDAQDGNIKQFSYVVDAAGRTTATTGPGGITTLSLDAEGDINSQTLSNGVDPTQVTKYDYSSPGRSWHQYVQDGSKQFTTTFVRDQRGQLDAVTDPNGNTTTYDYDPAGYLNQVCKPPITTGLGTSGQQTGVTPCTWIGHDSYGDVSDQDLPNNANEVTWFAYDGDGRLTSTTKPSYTAPGTSTVVTPYTTATYDGNGNLKTRTDPLNNVTSYTYTQLNKVATKTNPAIMVNGTMTQGVTKYSYDALGQPTQIIDPTGATSSATYDYLGHLATSTAVERNPAASYTTAFNYDSAGDLLTMSTPTEVATGQTPLPTFEQNTYNGLGQPTATTDAVGNTTLYTYGLSGALKSITAPDGTMTVDTIDAGGRRTTVSLENASGVVQSTTNYTYDDNGNITALKNPDGNTTTFSYDGDNNLIKQIEPVTSSTSITTQYGYDAAGDQVSYINGNGNLTQYTYNVWSLPEKTIEPSVPAATLPTRTTSYDADGRPSAYTEPGGVSRSVSYDALGDLAGESGSGGEAATATRSYSYDLDGRQTSAATAAGTDTFGYNDRGLLTSATGPSGAATFGYSADGQLKSRTDVAGNTTYAYDAADRLSTVTDQLTGVNTTYTYNQNSQVSEIYYQSSQGALGNILSQAQQTLTYGDARHDLTSSTLTLGGSTISQNYTYDNDGNVLTHSTSGLAGPSSNTYTYDQADRLASWNNGTSTVNYGYDGDGNRTAIGAQTLTYNADDQLTGTTGGSGPATTDTYDAAGNLTSQTTGSTTETMTYDAYDQMATDSGALYTYDALGRAVSAAGSTLAYSGLGTQQASDGSQLYALLPDGTPLAQQPVGASNGSGKYVLNDVHGDKVGTFNQTATAMAGSVGYDPLGNIDGTQGTGLSGAVGYQGGYTSPTGKVEMGSRWYSPATGQFTSRDSQTNSAQGASAGANRYGYANGNPLSLTDPTGHDAIPVPPELFLNPDALIAAVVAGGVAYGLYKLMSWAWDASQSGGSAAPQPFTGTLSQVQDGATIDYTYNADQLTTISVFDATGPVTFNGLDVSIGAQPVQPIKYVPSGPGPVAKAKPKPITPPAPCPLCLALQPARHPDTPPVELPDAGTITLKAPKLGAGVNPDGIAIPGEEPYRPTDAEPDPNPHTRGGGGDAPPPGAGDKRRPNETCQALRPSDAESIGGADAWASFGDLGGPAANRSTGVMACLDASVINQGTPTGKVRPAGYEWANSYLGWLGGQGSDAINNCHLLARQFGGSGTDLRNLATCSASANYLSPNSMYSSFEARVRQQIDDGDSVLYRVVPVYSGDRTVPYEFKMTETVWDQNGDLIQPLSAYAVKNTAQLPGGGTVNLGLAFNNGDPVPVGLMK